MSAALLLTASPLAHFTRLWHALARHCAAIPTSEDTPALVAARELEISILRQWVVEFHAERAAAKARLGQQ